MEKGMATHSSILAWRAPWTEEPGGLQSMGSQRVRHDWVSNTFTEKATVRENPFISWAWAGRKRLGATWDTGGPGDSKGRSHPPERSPRSWGPWAWAQRQWSEAPGEPTVTSTPECCHCSGHYRHNPLPNSPERHAALGVAPLRFPVQRTLKQSKHSKYQPLKGALRGEMWPLLVWSSTEKAVTIPFSSAATFWEDSIEWYVYLPQLFLTVVKSRVNLRSRCSPSHQPSFWDNWFQIFFPVAQTVKNPPAMQETWVQSLGQKDSLEEEMTTQSNVLAWRIPWTEEPGGLQSMGSQRVGHNWETNTFTFPFKEIAVLIL